MVHISDDYDDSVFALPAEGKYLAEVKRAEEKHTKTGDIMFILEFKDVTTGASLVTDFLSFGKAGYGMAKSKLQSLGLVAHGVKGFDITPSECVGARAFIFIKHEIYNDKEVAKVDIKQGIVGYEPEFGAPPVDESQLPASGEVPFG